MPLPQEIILSPVISEKSSNLLAENKYTFYVHPRANKIEIRRAIEEIFHVRVLKVNTLRVRGKRKRVGRFEGKKPDRKKAIVTLRPGDKIEIFEGF